MGAVAVKGNCGGDCRPVTTICCNRAATAKRSLQKQTLHTATHLGLQWLHSDVSPSLDRGALQPRHVSLTLANFMMPPEPEEGVDTVMARVWSPAGNKNKGN